MPSYQKMLGISATGRVTPDVSYDANPSTGFMVYDSLTVERHERLDGRRRHQRRAPQWAAIIAIADQARVASGLSTLTLGKRVIYTLYMTDTTSISTTSPAAATPAVTSAMTGYDAVTGLGSPIVSQLVNDLAVGHGHQHHGLDHEDHHDYKANSGYGGGGRRRTLGGGGGWRRKEVRGGGGWGQLGWNGERGGRMGHLGWNTSTADFSLLVPPPTPGPQIPTALLAPSPASGNYHRRRRSRRCRSSGDP